jgi:Flp pilus assembly protein TadG
MRRLLKDRAGAVLVEAALVWPTLFMVLFGAIELGQFIWTQAALTYAVQEAARCVAVRPDLCADDAQTLAYARARAAPLTLPAGAVRVAHLACGANVTAEIPYSTSVGSIVLPKSLTLRAQVCRR